MNARRTRICVALVAATTTLAAGCSSSGGSDTPAAASYAGAPVTLTIGTDDSPGAGAPSADQISHFAAEVDRLSAGKITIEPKWHAEGNDHPTDWDQAVAAMVQKGDLDLALTPTWAWDVLGVTSLKPLQAPFLVDSDDLVASVVSDKDVSHQLMAGLSDAGVEGISLWPEGLRHPFGFDKPLISPEDYQGETVRSGKSAAITQMFHALGAKTSAAEPDATTMVGSQAEFVLSPNGIGAANVTFFPKVNLLYANSARYASLDPEARQVLAAAATGTQRWVIERTDDVAAAQAFCADGGTLVRASDGQLAALRRATALVARDVAAEPGNAATIDSIGKLKSGIGVVDTPATCGGAKLARHEPGKAESKLNGTYRFTLTKKGFLDAGLGEESAFHNAGVQTYALKDGKVHYRLDPSEHEFGKDPGGPDEADGTYQVDGDILTFLFPVYNNEVDRVLFRVGDNGKLTLTAVDVPEKSVEFSITSEPWEKIR